MSRIVELSNMYTYPMLVHEKLEEVEAVVYGRADGTFRIRVYAAKDLSETLATSVAKAIYFVHRMAPFLNLAKKTIEIRTTSVPVDGGVLVMPAGVVCGGRAYTFGPVDTMMHDIGPRFAVREGRVCFLDGADLMFCASADAAEAISLGSVEKIVDGTFLIQLSELLDLMGAFGWRRRDRMSSGMQRLLVLCIFAVLVLKLSGVLH